MLDLQNYPNYLGTTLTQIHNTLKNMEFKII